MFAKLILLSSLFICSIANANEIGFNYSGYVYNTTFSDSGMHNSRTVMAINLDTDYSNYAIRTQIANVNSDFKLRRLVAEVSLPVASSTDVTYQIGRFGRVDSFYNSVLDSPSSYQMAILPFGGYSYRMFNGSFVLMDGQQMIIKQRTANGSMVSFRAAYGKMVIDEQSELQKEAIRTYINDIEMVPINGSYDLGLHYETRNWHAYIARQYFKSSQKALSNSKITQRLVDYFNNSEYTLDRYGIKYSNNAYYVQIESTHGKSFSYSANDNIIASINAYDYNYVLGYRMGDGSVYIGQSYGVNKTANSTNFDKFIGGTYNYDKLTMSLEYHIGEGRGWVKHDNPNSNYDWKTFILSTTLKF